MTMKPEEALETNLIDGEQIIWSARCDRRRSTSRFTWWLLGIPWLTGFLFFYIHAITSPDAFKNGVHFIGYIGLTMIISPFIAAGLYMVLLPFILRRDDRETLYTITNYRVLRVVSCRKVEALSLGNIGHIYHDARRDGWGDLVATSYVTSDSEGKTTHTMEMRGIPRVVDVHRTLAEARQVALK
jgi:hypothetical protein